MQFFSKEQLKQEYSLSEKSFHAWLKDGRIEKTSLPSASVMPFCGGDLYRLTQKGKESLDVNNVDPNDFMFVIGLVIIGFVTMFMVLSQLVK